MAAADTQAPPTEPAPTLPDYLTDPDAVLKDAQAKWRYGRAPDYSKTRKVFAESKPTSGSPLCFLCLWTDLAPSYLRHREPLNFSGD